MWLLWCSEFFFNMLLLATLSVLLHIAMQLLGICYVVANEALNVTCCYSIQL